MEQKLSEIIGSADCLIIGIGGEWNWVKAGLSRDKRYSQLTEYCKKEENHWLLPIVEYEYAYYNNDPMIEEAYKSLKKLIGDKKYFLVSDLFLQDALMYGFEPENSVYPCGNYMFLQTSDPDDPLMEARQSEDFMDIVNSIHRLIVDLDGNLGDESSFSHPILHGKQLYLNQKRSEYRMVTYNETAYKANWEKYMKFLTDTLNTNLLILELGVGLEYPTVVRWPFEKVTFVNKKAHFIRVHERLAHHTPEIADKTESIQMNSIDYILQESKGL